MIDQCSCKGEHHWLVLFDDRPSFLVGVFDECRAACRGVANDPRDGVRAEIEKRPGQHVQEENDIADRREEHVRVGQLQIGDRQSGKSDDERVRGDAGLLRGRC